MKMNNLLNEVYDLYGKDLPVSRPQFRAADEPLFRRVMKEYRVWFRFTAAYKTFLATVEVPAAPVETTLDEVLETDSIDVVSDDDQE